MTDTKAEIRTVAVLGAGTMGSGIAHVAAKAGCRVALYDLTEDLTADGMDRIRKALEAGVARGKVTAGESERIEGAIETTSDLKEAAAGADLVVEAAPESIDLKRKIFQMLGEICRPEAILASNTSSLSLTKISEATPNPGRIVGMHFFNPPHIMKLLEIVRARETTDACVDAVTAVARRMGKETIIVKDSPGFATSRLGLVIGLEAMRMVEEGVASPEDIDRALELGYGHPMGPLRVSDLVGLDVRLAIAEILHRELDAEHFRPPAILKEKVEAGKMGRKTGEGFYKWPAKK